MYQPHIPTKWKSTKKPRVVALPKAVLNLYLMPLSCFWHLTGIWEVGVCFWASGRESIHWSTSPPGTGISRTYHCKLINEPNFPHHTQVHMLLYSHALLF